MCGLSFQYNSGLSEPELLSNADLARTLLHHRGPDDSGITSGKSWVATHTRLSIIDLAGSKQPMQDPSQRYCLIFNGEIYNFHKLRQDLEGKWNFQTHGDTETLLAGLCIYGESFISKMQGMWAFAFWDSKTETLLLARDRFGKKPLYFTNTQNTFSCASELPPLLKIAKRSFSEDMDSTCDFIRYGFFLPGYTAYEDINELLPGHYLVWKPNRDKKILPYWSPDFTPYQGTQSQAQTLLRQKFLESIQKRLVSDVEIGAFLSGGIDSSLVVAILCKEFNTKPKTFTIGFSNNSYDERPFAESIAALFDTPNFCEELKTIDVSDLLQLVLTHCGQPFGDVSILPTALLARLASTQVKVALSGDGADELFSGYQRYHAQMLFRIYSQIPTPLTSVFEKTLQMLNDPSAHHSRSLVKKAKLFANAYHRQNHPFQYIAPEFLNHPTLQKVLPPAIEHGHKLNNDWDISREDDIVEMMVKDMQIYLPQSILCKVDRATMAFSLEARTPFLDTDLVETALSFPRNWHRNLFSGKLMLKRTFQQYLPNSIWSRRKQGFSVPLAEWFRGTLNNNFEDMLHSSESMLDKKEVLALLHSHKERKQDYSFTLWNMYIYLLWKQNRLNM